MEWMMQGRRWRTMALLVVAGSLCLQGGKAYGASGAQGLTATLPASVGSIQADTQSQESAATPASVQEADFSYSGLEMQVTMGYDGIITYLRKLPVSITLKNQGPDMAGLLVLDINRNEVEYDRYELPVQVASGAEVLLEMPVELTMKQKAYRMQLWVEDQQVALQTIDVSRVIDPSTLLVATLSDNPQALTHFVVSTTKDPLKRGEKWQTVALTVDTFPRNIQMMNSFSFLAVDGVDLNALDSQQKSTLDAWLRAGGIVIVGGGPQAATAYPYFQQYTGIAAGTLAQQEDVTPALLHYVKSAEEPLGTSMMIAQMQGGKGKQLGESQSLLDLCPVGSGYIMTAAFSLSDKPLNTWQSSNVLWQRLMITTIGDRYQEIVQRQTNYHNREVDYVDTAVMDAIPIPNGNSLLMPMVLLVVFVGLVGFGSYFALKRRDRLEWMWLTVPTLSVLFALGLSLVGGAAIYKQPVAVLSSVISQSEEGTITEKVRIAVATAENEPVAISVTGGELAVAGNQTNYYDTDPSNLPSVPNVLRYTYHQGDKSSVTFPAETAWRGQHFFARGENPPQLAIEGNCWWEEDGLHIRLINNGQYPMGEGYVIMSQGYCRVPALLPGETVNCEILNPTAEMEKAGKQQPYNSMGNPTVVEGMMIATSQQAHANIYSVINAIVYPEHYAPTVQQVDGADYASRTSLEGLLNMCSSGWDWYQNTNIYHYLSLDDGICDMVLEVNEQPVRRTAQRNIIDVTLAYQPISESGLAKYPRGTIPVYQAEKDEETGAYVRTVQIQEMYRYFRLTDKPIFCFVLPDSVAHMKVSQILLQTEYIYGDYVLQAFHVKTKEWVELDVKKPLEAQLDIGSFVNGEGELYLQYLPAATTDAYVELNTPYLTLEGRME